MSKLPKISCLTITKNRLVLLKQAINCFMRQTYPNKELVIVSDGDAFYNASVHRFIQTLDSDEITMLEVKPAGESLGKLRNIAWNNASGEFVCQWDDDDQYHPRRLEIQYSNLVNENAYASFLVEQLQLFCEDQVLLLANWPSLTNNIRHQLIPGTLLVRNEQRFRYDENGNFSRKGEDDELIDKMVAAGVKISGLSGEAGLYLYQYHGANTFSREHHYHLGINRSATAEKLLQDLPQIFEALNYYNIPTPLRIFAGQEQVAVYSRTK
mgnify:CR=1 FL=1